MLEILAHVNKRIKALPSLQLPLHDLVALYGSPQSGPMARNFALVYIENAAGRASAQARFAEVGWGGRKRVDSGTGLLCRSHALCRGWEARGPACTGEVCWLGVMQVV